MPPRYRPKGCLSKKIRLVRESMSDRALLHEFLSLRLTIQANI
jgi:hypothetical protein